MNKRSCKFAFLFAYNILMALTKRQKEFLDFLSGFLEKRGYSPSYEEIAEGLNLGFAGDGA